MISIREQFIIFTYCMLAGFLSGFVYDICKSLKAMPELKRFSPITDLIFWSAVLYIFFSVLFLNGSGQMRGYAVIGFIIGFTIYLFTISKVTGKLLKKIIGLFFRLLSYAVMPLKKFFVVLRKIISKFIVIVQTTQKTVEKIVRNTLEKYK